MSVSVPVQQVSLSVVQWSWAGSSRAGPSSGSTEHRPVRRRSL